jgi:hypothetical protein
VRGRDRLMGVRRAKATKETRAGLTGRRLSKRGKARLFGATAAAHRESEKALQAQLDQTDLVGFSKSKGYRYRYVGKTKTGRARYDQYHADGTLRRTGYEVAMPGKRTSWWRRWTLAKGNVGRDKRSGRFTPR